MQVATLGELSADKAYKAKLGETEIILLRVGDGVRAYQAKCPHAGAPLDEGAVCNGRIVCPWHKASFAVADGALLEPPALDRLIRYPVTLDGDRVLVEPEKLAVPAPQPQLADKLFLIVGAGAAGVAAACALREFGFAGRVILLGAEAGAPYDRTALSKFVLEGAMPPDEVTPLREPGFFAAHGIEHRHGTAVDLDPVARRVTLADGGTIAYDAALLCPGGAPRMLDIPGADLPTVHVLRSVQDARAILADARPDARAVVIGGSFIGLECASALTKRGLHVTVVSPEALPFAKIFGAALAGAVRRLHEGNGVTFVTGQAQRIDPAGVTLDDGRHCAADLVVVGVGVRPATGFASALPLAEDGGIVVDISLRAGDSLYAAGDVASFPFKGEHVRIEHWRVAQQHGRVAARGMLGDVAAYRDTPFFWTYHFGHRIELLGHAAEVDETTIDGEPDAMTFLARQYSSGKLVAVVGCQREAETAGMAAIPAAVPA